MSVTDQDHPLAADIDRINRLIVDLTGRLPAAELQWQKLDDKAQKTGLKLLAADDRGRVSDKLREQSRKEDAEAEKAHRAYTGLLDSIAYHRDRLKRLHEPQEITKRVEQRLRLNNLKEREMAKKETAKDQGFPDVYLGENGNFKPGMDARAKSDLVSAFLGQESKGALAEFTKAQAKKLLEKRDWMVWVEKRQASTERKAEKAAEKKAAAAKAKANGTGDGAVTEETVAGIEAEHNAENDADFDQVKPDPKPERAPRSGRGPRSRAK